MRPFKFLSYFELVQACVLQFIKGVLKRNGKLFHWFFFTWQRIHQVGHNGLVHSLEGAGPRALLLLVGAAAVGALGAGEDAAGRDDDNVAIRELLLQLAGEAFRNQQLARDVGRGLTAVGPCAKLEAGEKARK